MKLYNTKISCALKFCMTILTRKLSKIFLLKFFYKNSCVKFDIFSRRNGLLIFLQKEALKSKRVNNKQPVYLLFHQCKVRTNY